MQLTHSFLVPVPPEDAWDVLLDIERIAPCLPGATLSAVSEDGFDGSVKIKLGPIALTYRGHGTFVEKNAEDRRATIRAEGRDVRGNGTASTTITATLAASVSAPGTTSVTVVTELAITGRPAQFGRGVIGEVGDKLIGEFAARLSDLLSTNGIAVVPGEAAAGGVALPVESRESPSDSLDLTEVVRSAIAKQALVPIVLVVAAIIVLGRRLTRAKNI
jgi:carbon monoxide dehydrogenase subunit G